MRTYWGINLYGVDKEESNRRKGVGYFYTRWNCERVRGGGGGGRRGSLQTTAQ